MRPKALITALYGRLSHDDEQLGESNSIINQKQLLEEYARSNGFGNIRHFTDDGISGTRFDRDGFQAMFDLIERGQVGIVCVKDMSRFGRDYLKVGIHMETMRKMGVRLIAVNDGVDTFGGDDDFTPFRNIMNEWYARDISKKIKSTFQAKGKSGRYVLSTPPYGYLKDQGDKNKWVIDEKAAVTVRRIFHMVMQGLGPYQIAQTLSAEKVEIPGYHLQKMGLGHHRNKTFKDPYSWGSSTICQMLRKQEYAGHTVNFKTTKHFKDKRSQYVPQDEWLVFKNTHEPIIDQTTFDNVQRIRASAKRYPDGWGKAHPLTGLMYCADCGGKMYVHRVNNGKRIPQYVCSNYKKAPSGTLCKSGHRIKADHVMELVSNMVKAVMAHVEIDKLAFVKEIQNELKTRQTTDLGILRKQLAHARKRILELEVLIAKIYEDNAFRKLSDKRYETLSNQYESELAQLKIDIDRNQQLQEQYEQDEDSAKYFLQLLDKYQNFDILSTVMLNELVEKIVVHERERKGSQNAIQDVDIHFNFVGNYQPPQPESQIPTPEELEVLRKKEERRQKLHQNYLQRKASGRQKEYEDRMKERMKRQLEENKVHIHAEDIANGALVSVDVCERHSQPSTFVPNYVAV